ncbi:hypothetical protein L1049_001597 [Liquidambar formosana]|uniref:Uncharacterized protein n=1 Tax=Liquidambar formosana TaxID=63359 RepID=A0AAP0N4P7_LIQFO
MDEQHSLRGNGGGGASLLRGNGGGGVSLLHHPTMSNSIPTTFSPTLTHYTTGLLTSDYTFLFCNSSELRSDACYDDEQPSGGGGGGGYWKSFLVLDLIWNLAFVLVSVIVLLSTFRERPLTPLRVWICGYASQCLLHVGLMYLKYLRKNQDGVSSQSHRRFVKRLESLYIIFSSSWLVLGFFWIFVGGQELLQDSPRLYWLALIFLAFDVLFMIFCIVVACIIFFALFCCVPIVAIAYAMTIREGASEDDIRILPKYRFRQANPSTLIDNEKKQEIVGATLVLGNGNSTNELALHPEDSLLKLL